MPKPKQITEPLVEIRLNRYNVERVYLLTSGDEFFVRPAKGTKVVGPALIVTREIGSEAKTTVTSLRGKNWKHIGELMRVGAWALHSKPVAALMTDDMAKLSPRFARTTKRQRKHFAATFKTKT